MKALLSSTDSIELREWIITGTSGCKQRTNEQFTLTNKLINLFFVSNRHIWDS